MTSTDHDEERDARQPGERRCMVCWKQRCQCGPPRQTKAEIERALREEADARERFPFLFESDGSLKAQLAIRERRALKAELNRLNAQVGSVTNKIRSMVTKDVGDQSVIDSWRMLEFEARVFHFQDTLSLWKIVAAYPQEAEQPPLLAKPFPVFMFAIDSPLEYTAPDEGQQDDDTYRILSFRTVAFLVDARDDAAWKAYELQRLKLRYYPKSERGLEPISNRVSGEYEVSAYSGPQEIIPETSSVLGLDESGKGIDVDGSLVDIAASQQLSAGLATRAFCAFANHIAVSAVEITDPQRPPNRQQRRAQGYVERTHYRVIVKGRVERIASDIAQAKNVRERREHEVRGHLRHYSSGRVSTVRPHKRCRGKGEFIKNEYEVASYVTQ